MLAKVRAFDPHFAGSQVPDDWRGMRILAGNGTAYYGFRQAQSMMAKALATSILPKALNGGTVRRGFPVRQNRHHSGAVTGIGYLNPGNSLRWLALPANVEHSTLARLRDKLMKTGAKGVRHARYVTFQLAEVAVSRDLFRVILDRIGRFRAVSSAFESG